MFDSIILLGKRDAGKDSALVALSSLLPTTNIKFSGLTKNLIDTMAGEPGLCNNKEKRTSPMPSLGGLSALWWLDALFALSETHPDLATANRETAIAQATQAATRHQVPVFTDIRKPGEMDAVIDSPLSPLVFLLSAPSRDSNLDVDKFIDQLATRHSAIVLDSDQFLPFELAHQILQKYNEYICY